VSRLNNRRFILKPGMNGLVLLREIKARFPECLVLLMTGHGDPSLRMEAVRLGATAFLEKPLDIEHLGGLLSRALEQPPLINAVQEANPQISLGS
jgi:DNA-binding NtrC family response regulator